MKPPEPNRAPSKIWCLRREQFYPVVYTAPDDLIVIHDGEDQYLYLSRPDARLLAKRINQCLDSTVKK